MNQASHILRCLVVATSMAAWFVLSNHCVLAAPSVLAKGTASSQCPLHAQTPHAPQSKKGNGCDDLPCCKNLQANLTVAKAVAKPVWLGALQQFFPQVIDVAEIQARQMSETLDTGPPGENSFVQSVLQQSILAHAPPGSLS